MLEIKVVVKRVSTQKYTPSVVEPSFGVGRILYAIFEHSFYSPKDQDATEAATVAAASTNKKKNKKKNKSKGDASRCVMRFKPAIAPVKCALCPLTHNDAVMDAYVHKLAGDLRRRNVSVKVDDSGASIGKRYARMDEIGVPFGVTVDFETLKDGELNDTVTLRDRDTREQIRVPVDDIPGLVADLSAEYLTFEEAKSKYPTL
jgi:glycyl-tRNA synthetase